MFDSASQPSTPTATDTAPRRHPSAVLYATSAGLGGSGLDSTSLEGVLAAFRHGVLKKALCYPNRQKEIPHAIVRSLQLSPVRLLSCLGSNDYYAAKKRYLDRRAAHLLRSGAFDLFHGWVGESFETLVEARLRHIPSVLDVATWHRNKGATKSGETRSEREARHLDRGWRDWRKHLHASRAQNLAEYDLASVLLMPSRKSEETFLSAGVSPHKLHYVGRGVDLKRYQPAEPPEIFRVAFTGALIRRKGVHHLLAAWKKLQLPDSELILIGSVHGEIKAELATYAQPNVKVLGFCSRVQDELRRCAAFVFPSECEGFAKATLEAAACGLPLIATQESGDAIIDGQTGLLIPPNDPEALAEALRTFHAQRDRIRTMGANARRLVEQQFTWDHYRERIWEGYARAVEME